MQIAKIIKHFNKSIYVVIGGYHPTLRYEKISEEDTDVVDFIIKHEGELAFRDLIREFENGKDFSKIKNLSYNIDGMFYHNESSGNLDLEEIQFPDRSARILKGYHAWGLPCDVIETSRGCTFDCTFCTIIKMYGRTFRRYPIQRTIQDIKDAKKRGAKAIFTVDDNITLNMHHLEEVCDAIIAEKLNDIHYITQASVQGISSSKKIVDKMAKAGFKTVFLGIENASEGNLEFLGKDNQVNNDRTERAVAYLRENGIIVLGAMIVGNPEDNENTMWQNFYYSRKLKVDGPLFFNPTPHIKTEMREDMLKMGIVVNKDDFSWYMGVKANARTKHLTPDEVNRIVLEMHNKFQDFEYFKYNSIRKIVPKYFYIRAFKEIVDKIWKKFGGLIGILDKDPLKIAMKRDMKRREKWLLEDLNKNCKCFNCSLGRGENPKVEISEEHFEKTKRHAEMIPLFVKQEGYIKENVVQ
jgi:radical SAM superfamily enzyme YgiQ (UPF0313 family)